ncbi:MAG: GrpB family protein [Candidatus Thorarchaeota archaeon]
MVRRIVLVDYDPQWRILYDDESQFVSKAFGDLLVSIHHIGSTSIPEICAKPIIDILVEVHDIKRVDEMDDMMIAIGYRPRGEVGIPGRRYFSKDIDERRTHHVHSFQTGSQHLQRHLDFRDYLRVHPDEAMKYCRLKREFAATDDTDIDRYTKGKTVFIKDVEKKAKAWRRAI